MKNLNFFTEDIPLKWQISNVQIAKNVHYHTIDEQNKHQIVNLPFTVENNVVNAILPANSKFLFAPELEVQIIREKMTDEKADEIIRAIHG